jgi:protein gp37
MSKTKIEWCDDTWNPVTGCLHDCGYCYARGIARRFGGYDRLISDKLSISSAAQMKSLNELYDKLYRKTKSGKTAVAPYPFGFEPTLHYYKLNEYRYSKAMNIFVGSMCDLFGEFIPDDWITEVLNACAAAPQHNYLFLTKNPERYEQLNKADKLNPNSQIPMWCGTTITCDADIDRARWLPWNEYTFLSVEPLLEKITNFDVFLHVDWVIIGAESGNRKGKVKPRREWIDAITTFCGERNIPVFMKSGEILNRAQVIQSGAEPRYFMQELMSNDFRQEFPKELIMSDERRKFND